MTFSACAARCLALAGLSLAAVIVHAAPVKRACHICKIALQAGMTRSDVEQKVAASLGQESHYSPYANNLAGGVVAYRDGNWILRVTYQQGSPAPRVINAAGVGEHMLPIDEKVLSFTLIKRAAQATSAD